MNTLRRFQELAGIAKENEVNSIDDPNMYDDVPSVRINIDDHDGTDKMFIEISSLFHDEGNGKVTLLKNNPALQEVLMKALQVEIQKAFRTAVHSVTGEPFGIK